MCFAQYLFSPYSVVAMVVFGTRSYYIEVFDPR